MKLFSDLQTNKAVQLDNDMFVVQLNRGEYVINGKEVQHTIYEGQVVVDSIDDIVRIVHVPGEVVHYKNKFDESMLSVAEYTALVQEISDIAEQYQASDDDGDDDIIFPSLEIEFEYMKKQRHRESFIAVRDVDTKRHEQVVIDVVGSAVATGSEFIETPFVYGRVSFASNGSIFRVNASAVAADEFNNSKALYPTVKFENSTHSNIRFAKGNDNFIFNDKMTGVTEGQTRLFTDLNAAKEFESEIRNLISSKMRHAFAPTTITKDIVTSSKLLYSIESISNIVASLQVKVVSDNSHREVKRQIAKLYEMINKIE